MAFQDGVKYVPTTVAAAAASGGGGGGAVSSDGASAGSGAGAGLSSSGDGGGDGGGDASGDGVGGGGGGSGDFCRPYDDLRQARKELWGHKRKSRWAKDALSLKKSAVSEVRLCVRVWGGGGV